MDLKSTIDSTEYNIRDIPMRGPPAARAPASTRSPLIFMDFQASASARAARSA
jgi:hypothetical protein